MKKNIYNYLALSVLFLTIGLFSSCKDRKNDNEINRYDSLPEQERLHGDPDPLNERDASGGTIDNHQERTANQTDNMKDTL